MAGASSYPEDVVTTPTDDQLQDAAATLSHLVDLAAEGPTGHPDLHHAITQLDPDHRDHTLAVAAAVIHDDRTRHDALLDHGAQTNRDLRIAHDRYLAALQHIVGATASPKIRRIATDALAP